MKTLKSRFLLFHCLPILLLVCQKQMAQAGQKPKSLIYCGITMGKVARELANRFAQYERGLVKKRMVFTAFGLGQ